VYIISGLTLNKISRAAAAEMKAISAAKLTLRDSMNILAEGNSCRWKLLMERSNEPEFKKRKRDEDDGNNSARHALDRLGDAQTSHIGAYAHSVSGDGVHQLQRRDIPHEIFGIRGDLAFIGV